MLEHVTRGGKVFVVGLLVGAAGAALVGASMPFPPTAAGLSSHPRAAGLLAAGVAIAVVGIFVYVFKPEPGVQVASVRNALAMLVAAVVLANLASLPLLARGAATGAGAGPLGLAYLIAASEIPIILVVWLRLKVIGHMSWQELGLKLRPVAIHVIQGLFGGAALFIAAALVGGILTAVGVKQNQFQRFQGIEGAPLGLFIVAAAAGCVLAPFAEELFFRGYIFQTFLRRWGTTWAYLFSAGLFAIVHLNIAAAVPIFVLGLMLAFLYQRTQSLVPGMIAHGINNAISFCLLYFVGVRG